MCWDWDNQSTVLIWIDFVGKYVFQLCTSFLIKSYLFTSAFNMSDSETILLKFELGISNDLAIINSLL
jgi:hypothetical protein